MTGRRHLACRGLRLVRRARRPWRASASPGSLRRRAAAARRPGHASSTPATASGSASAPQILEVLGATVRLGDGDTLPDGVDLLVVSPGLPPLSPIIAAALERGRPGVGRARAGLAAARPRPPRPGWSSPGTNGKTTTTLMLESMLRAAGLRTVAAGNIGVSLVDVVMAMTPRAPGRHRRRGRRPAAAVPAHHEPAGLGVPEHRRRPHRPLRLVRGLRRGQGAHLRAHPGGRRLQRGRRRDPADGRGGRRRRGLPGDRLHAGRPRTSSMLGVVDDLLVDRAFVADRQRARPGARRPSHDVRPSAPHNVANALAAAALARALRRARGGGPRRAARVRARSAPDRRRRRRSPASRYVDDSKATNCHAAQTSLIGYDPVVWIAGGLAKGQQFDDLVRRDGRPAARRGAARRGPRRHRRRARATRARMCRSSRCRGTDTGAMDEVVAAAAAWQRPGDTVLLAPGARRGTCSATTPHAATVRRGRASLAQEGT